MKMKWTKKWPTKEGMYFFYGWPYGDTKDIGGNPIAPELNYVKTMKVSNGMMIVREGNFWYKSEGYIGLFAKIDDPELPDMKELSKLPDKNP